MNSFVALLPTFVHKNITSNVYIPTCNNISFMTKITQFNVNKRTKRNNINKYYFEHIKLAATI